MATQQATAKVMPTGVKVIYVLYYIIGIIYLLLWIWLMSRPLPYGFEFWVKLFRVTSIGFGVLYIFVARGLWKGQNWARILAIILSGQLILIGLPFFSFSPFKLFLLAVNIPIVWYLAFSPEVKSAFA